MQLLNKHNSFCKIHSYRFLKQFQVFHSTDNISICQHKGTFERSNNKIQHTVICSEPIASNKEFLNILPKAYPSIYLALQKSLNP